MGGGGAAGQCLLLCLCLVVGGFCCAAPRGWVRAWQQALLPSCTQGTAQLQAKRSS